MTMNASTAQHITSTVRPAVQVVPPLAEEFSVHGGQDTVERAREWALTHRLLLVKGVPACAHGLYLMQSCPNFGERCCRAFDHTHIWLPAEVLNARPFLLTHPFTAAIADEIYTYAAAHGLVVQPGTPFDTWYGHGSLPIRLTIPDGWPVWPIEIEASALLTATPVAWPE